MTDLAREFMKQNFYYTHLKGRLEKGYEADFKNGLLIVGSSHALCGIDESKMTETVSCSMHSQDIFYDCLCVKEVLGNLKGSCSYGTCVIIMGYYMPFQDLSLSKYSRESYISRTYYPIFHDAHNWDNPVIYDHWHFCRGLTDEEKLKYEKEAVDRTKVLPFYCEQTVKRKLLYDFGGRTWKELSEEERDNYGEMRANSHNSLEGHPESFRENLDLMKDIVSYLDDRDVKMFVVVTPFTHEYSNRVSATMKKAFFQMMEEAQVPTIIDFNESCYSENFDVDDFQDMDHMNEHGAAKLSEILADQVKC